MPAWCSPGSLRAHLPGLGVVWFDFGHKHFQDGPQCPDFLSHFRRDLGCGGRDRDHDALDECCMGNAVIAVTMPSCAPAMQSHLLLFWISKAYSVAEIRSQRAPAH